MVDEHSFWSTREPGIRSLPAAGLRRAIARIRRQRPDWVAEYDAEVDRTDRVRRLLSQGQYPQMNEGNADLYKAFCWRFWKLARDDGAVGVVLPRTALSGKGSAMWRKAILDSGQFADVTLILNNMSWAFEDVHPQYTFALIALRSGPVWAGSIGLRGPFSSLSRFREGTKVAPARFAVEEFRAWSDAASFPLLPSAEAASIFQKLRAHQSLGNHRDPWRARPIQGDFNATTDKGLFILDEDDAPDDAWAVYKGASFNIWQPDTGTYYAWADAGVVTDELQRRRLKGQKSAKSAFSEFSREWAADSDTLPCWYPRIAFRDITNRTNSRTVIACLLPGEIVLTNKAPYLLWPTGDEHDEAFLLGVLCSMPLDWYARRVVEVSLNFHLFNGFPVADPGRDHPVRRRVEQIAGRLAAVDDWYEAWAEEVGVPVGSVTKEEQPDLLAELDAAVAVLYGLDQSDLRVIYDTFHEGADYSAHCERVLHHHREMA
jgi:hypothetical protein